jgi:diguanylate cyclase (GGDEF)-like protein/PAS domain S-box-containing protein
MEEVSERPDHFVVSAVDWQTIVDALLEGVAVLDTRGRVLACNEAAASILGRPMGDLVGRTPLELDLSAVGEDGEPLAADAYPSAAATRTGRPIREQVVGVLHADGQRRWLSVSATPMGIEARPASVVLTFRDVTERRDYEAELQRLAEVDELTGLPNRRAFLAVLAEHLASRRREDSRGALLVLDLDRFKELNDTLGHAVGDRLLVNAARAMEDRLRTTDFIGRLAGDEFAVLLPRADEREAEQVAAALAERLREERAPTAQGGVRPVSASIGVVPLSGAAGASVDRALQSADDAMYAAKAAGRGGWQVASPGRPRVPDGTVEMGIQLAKRARQLALANALGERLHEMADIREIAEATVEELHRAFGYHMCAVIRVGGDRVDALAVRGSPFVALAMRDWTQPVGDGLIGRCLRERAPLLVNDVRADGDYVVTPETADVRAELVAPLLVEGGVWGALNLEELVEDAFDDDDAQLLCIVANQVAAAIRAAGLTQRLERAAGASR